MVWFLSYRIWIFDPMWSQLIPTHSSHLNFKSSVCRMLSWDARMYNLTALCISLLIHSFLVFGTWWKRRIILVSIDFFCTVLLNKVVNFFIECSTRSHIRPYDRYLYITNLNLDWISMQGFFSNFIFELNVKHIHSRI